jgi:hypothetical protein
MKLTELNPKLSLKILALDCPKCKTHRLKIRLGLTAWRTNGSNIETLSLHTSYQSQLPCGVHFHISNGLIILSP